MTRTSTKMKTTMPTAAAAKSSRPRPGQPQQDPLARRQVWPNPVLRFRMARATGMTSRPCMSRMPMAETIVRAVPPVIAVVPSDSACSSVSSDSSPISLIGASSDWPKMTVRTEMTAWMSTAMPKVAAGLRRQAWNAPSMISPRPRGRSGITPGFGRRTVLAGRIGTLRISAGACCRTGSSRRGLDHPGGAGWP